MIKRKVFYLFILIVLIGLINCSTTKRLTANDHFKKGLHYDSIMDYKRSIKEYSAAIKKSFNNPMYHVRLAEATFLSYGGRDSKMQILVSNDYNNALHAAVAINASDSVFEIIYSSRLKFHYTIDHNKIVIEQANWMMNRFPKYYIPFLYEGLTLLKMEDTLKANSMLDTAFLYASDKASILSMRAGVEYNMGTFNQAVLHYQQLKKLGEISLYDSECLYKSYWFEGKKDSACIYFHMVHRSFNTEYGIDKTILDYCGE